MDFLRRRDRDENRTRFHWTHTLACTGISGALNRNRKHISRRFCLTAVLRGLERSGSPALRRCGEASIVSFPAHGPGIPAGRKEDTRWISTVFDHPSETGTE